ncbi:hypothetical protein ACFE6N_18195 [Pedobacter sp. BG31]
MQILKLNPTGKQTQKRPYFQMETPEITNLNASSLMVAMAMN